MLSTLNFPEIFPTLKHLKPIVASTPNRMVLLGLKKGESYCYQGTYGTAMHFYSWLKRQVNINIPINDYQSSRRNKDALRRLTQGLFVKIVDGRISLDNSPDVPWLKEFYHQEEEYYIRFTDVLGINGAWQWHRNGVDFPGLNHKLHPYYGAYFPTRTEHLELFDGWLASKKPLSSAIDMGTGCGILTFYMLKYGVQSIKATDINPNALYSLAEDLKRTGHKANVTTLNTSLFNGLDLKDTDLVVFNPPWIPDNASNVLDVAMYYDPSFFDSFFQEAHRSLTTDCTLVILFSTFAQAAGICNHNPIEQEISQNKRFRLIDKTEVPVKQRPSKNKHWLSEIRQNERVELWELVKM